VFGLLETSCLLQLRHILPENPEDRILPPADDAEDTDATSSCSSKVFEVDSLNNPTCSHSSTEAEYNVTLTNSFDNLSLEYRTVSLPTGFSV